MNHIYKVVFNKTTNTFTAVAEFAKSQGKDNTVSQGAGGAAVETVKSARITPISYAVFAALGFGLAAQAHATAANSFYDTADYSSIAIGETSVSMQGASAYSEQVNADKPNMAAGSHHSIAIGGLASTRYTWYGTALGFNASVASPARTQALGSDGAAMNSGSSKGNVALGAYSIAGETNTGQEAQSFTVGGKTYTFAGAPTANTSVLAVGSGRTVQEATGQRTLVPGGGNLGNAQRWTDVTKASDDYKYRQIQYVAAGRVAADSTDAINGSQLYQVLEVAKNSSGAAVPNNYFHVNEWRTDQPAGDPATNYGPIDAKGGATGQYALAAGKDNKASGMHSVAVGYKNTAGGLNSVLVGVENETPVLGQLDTSQSTTVVGSQNKAMTKDGTATIIGYQNKIEAADAKTSIKDSIAIGSRNTISGESSVALGETNKVNTNYAAALGRYNEIDAKSESALAVGRRNIITNGEHAYALGNNNTVSAPTALAVGRGNQVSASQSAALGFRNNVRTDNTFVLGSDTAPTQANSVVLGAGSTDRAATTESQATLNGLTYGTFAGQGSAAKGVVSVGKAGGERQLINVAAGKISATSTDAINGSQLYATNQVLGNAANAVVQNFGGNARLNPNKQGDITFTNIGGTGKNTVHEAVAAARTEVQSGKNTNVAAPASGANGQKIYKVDAWDTTVRAGDGISVSPDNNQTAYTRDYTIALSQQVKDDINKGKAAKDAVDTKGITFNGDSGTDVTRKLGEALAVKGNAKNARDLTDGNIGVVSSAADNALYVKLNKNLNLTNQGSVTLGGTKLNSDGLNITGGPSVTKNGINAGNKTISGVADGVNNDDAVNVKQLKAAKTEVVAGENVTVEPSQGSDGNPKYTVSAKDTSAKVTVADNSKLTVANKGTAKEGTADVTNFELDLSQSAKDSLAKADTAVQSFTTSVNGQTAQTVRDNGNVNFVNGNATTARNVNGGDIAFDVKTDNTTIKVDGGVVKANTVALNVAGGKVTAPTTTGALVTADDVANAINKSGWNLKAGFEATGEQINPSDSVTFKAGKNLKVERDGSQITYATKDDVSFDSVTLGHDSNVKLTDDGEGNLMVGGDKGPPIKITNLAAGENDEDAVNVSQLKTAKTVVQEGKNTKVTKTQGADKQDVYTVDAWDTKVAAADGAAVTVASKDDDNAKTRNYTIDLSQAIKEQIAKEESVVGEGNITVAENGTNQTGGKEYKVTLNKNVNLGDDGSLIVGPVTINKDGINAGNKSITNVEAGKNPTDAVNVDQLTKAAAAAKTEVKAGTNVTVDTDTTTGANGQTIYTVNAWDTTATGSEAITVTPTDEASDTSARTRAYAIDLSGKTKEDIQKGVDAKNAVDTQGITFAGDTGNSVTRKLGETVNVKGNAAGADNLTDGNIGVVADGTDTLTVKLNKDVNLTQDGSLTIGGTRLNGKNLTVGGANPVVINGDNGTVNGLTNKTFNPNAIVSGQAATEDQLKNVYDHADKGWNIQANNDTASRVAPGGTVQFINGKNIAITRNGNDITVATADDVAFNQVTANEVKIGPVTIHSDGINAGSKQIKNVADGTDPNDAVNVSQLTKAAAAATTELEDGKNTKVGSRRGDNGQTIYKVDAWDTTASAGSEAVTVTPTGQASNADEKTRAYAIDLSDKSKQSLAKADTAVQRFTTSVNGETVQTIDQTNNEVKFVDGNATTAQNQNGAIAFDVETDGTTVKVDGGKLAVNTGNITTEGNKAKSDSPETSIATVGDVVNAVNNAGFTLKTSANGGSKESGADEVIKAGGIVDMAAGKNLTVKQEENGKVTYGLNRDLDLTENGSVKLGNTALTADGLIINNGPMLTHDGEGNFKVGKVEGGQASPVKITNLAEGTEDSDAVNLSQLKAAQAAATTKVAEGDGIMVEETKNNDGSTTYTVTAVTDEVTTTINKNGEIAAITGGITVTGGKGEADNPDSLITAGDVAKAINNSGWNLAAEGTDGEELVKPGDTVTFKAKDNLNVTRENGSITYGLNKDVDLTGDGSVLIGSTALTKDGLIINNGPMITHNGSHLKLGSVDGNNTVSPIQIQGVESGLKQADGSPVTLAEAQGEVLNNAVNVGDLKNASQTLVDKGFNITADHSALSGNAKEDTVKLGEKVNFTSTDKNIVTTVADNEIRYALNTDLTLGGKDGVNGKDGVDGKIGINGKDGSAVVINGKDGSIGLNGKDGANGLTLKGADGAQGVDGKGGADGLPGKDGETRLVYEIKDPTTGEPVTKQVANLDDGLIFTGNNGTLNRHKLNTLVTVEGEGVSKEDAERFRSAAGNISVEADGGSKLTVKLNRDLDLTEKGSVKLGNTALTSDGLIINNGPMLTHDGNGNFKVGKVEGGQASPVKITNLAEGTEDSDAVNLSQLKAAQAAATTKVAEGDGIMVEETKNNDGSTTYTVTAVTDEVTTTINKNGEIAAITGGITVTGGKGEADNPDSLITAGDVAKAINNSGWNLAAEGTDGEELVKPGDTVTFKAKDNLNVTRENGSITYGLNKDVDLTGDGSVLIGSTALTKDGLIINNGPMITHNGSHLKLGSVDGNNTVSPIQIQGVESGLKQADGSPVTLAEAQGEVLNNAVNVGDLKNASQTLVDKGFNITADHSALSGNAKEDTVKLGEKVNFTSTDKNIVTTVADNEIRYALNTDLTLGGKDGVNGKDGVDGKIGINGKDGSAVVINGKDGSIGLNGKDGANGLTLKGADGAQGVDGKGGADGLPGKDGETRLVYEIKDPTTGEPVTKQVANLDDGLIFTGNNGTLNRHKLNTLVTVEGEGVSKEDAERFRSAAGNISVEADGGSKLTVKLNRDLDLTEKGSVKLGNTALTSDGLIINNGPMLTHDGNGNFKVGKVEGGQASPVKITNLAEGTEDSDAVNLSQLKAAQAAATTKVAEGDGIMVEETKNNDGSTTYTVTAVTDEVTTTINKNGEIAAITGGITVTGGKGEADNPDSLITAGDVAKAINNSGWNLAAEGTDGEELVKPGDTVTFKAKDNLNVTRENGSITYGLNKDVDLTGDGSVLIGSTALTKDGLIINNGPMITHNGSHLKLGSVDGNNTVSPIQIQGVESGLKQADGSPVTLAEAQGEVLNNAVNVGDLKNASQTLVDKGFNITADHSALSGNAKEDTVKLGEKVNFTSTDKNIVTTVADNEIRYALNTDLTLGGKDGVNGKDGVDGKIGINGKDGSAVVINGKDGSIGLNGKDGANGLTLKGADGAQGVDGKGGADGLPGKDGETRLVYEIKDPTTGEPVTKQVANLDDGLIFTGNNGTLNRHKLNTLVTVEGEGVSKEDAERFRSAAGNISVEADGGSKLTVKLNRDLDLTEKGSVKLGNTALTSDGLIINNGPMLTHDGNGNFKVGKVEGGQASPVKITNLAEGTEDSDAVNLSQLKAAQAAATTKVAEGDGIMVEETKNNDGSTTYTVTAVTDEVTTTINKNGEIAAITGGITVTGGKGEADNPDSLITAGDVAKAINNSGWNLAVDGTDGKELINPADTVTFKAKNNITVERDGANITYGLNKDVDLTKDGSLTIGDTKLDGNSLKVGGNNPVTIDGDKGTIGGLTNKTWDPNKITSGQAATEDQLKQAVSDAVDSIGFTLKTSAADGGKKTLGDDEVIKSGQAVELVAGNNMIVKQEAGGKVTFATTADLKADTVTVGEKGEPGKDGKDGTIGVNGKDGSAVVINGKDGSIGLNGKDGANGLTLKGADGAQGVNGQDGADGLPGQNGETRLVYETKDKDGNTKTNQVANLDDGLIFTGNNGELNRHKLNTLVTVKGEGVDKDQSAAFQSAAGNINVKADGNGTLEVQLAKDVKVGSVTANTVTANTVTAGNTTVNTDGITIGGSNGAAPVSLTGSGLNNGGNRITNVAPGVADTDAVNVGQLKRLGGDMAAIGKKAYAGVAGAIAQSSIPQVTRPGVTGFGIGGGHYGGQSAVAIGMSSMSDGGNWIIKGNVSTNTNGTVGIGAGALYQW
ncbi:YadA-like family protein [Neisseria leonii]|uniref:YadA-like family protein n=1 Tax=Neisseria leonii TaxID=2995413 RepID=UPI0030CE2FA7